MKKYTEHHEWIEVEGDIGCVGITEHAQKELGELVYAELPKVGQRVKAGEEIVVLESTKAASDVYSPVSGVVTAVNHKAPEDTSWLVKIRLTDPTELDKLSS